MGDYTQFHLNVKLNISSKEIKILNLLNFMCSNKYEEPLELPDNDLFNSKRSMWKHMFKMNSSYIPMITYSRLMINEYETILSVNCNFKEYDNEIKNFLEWIEPFLTGYIFTEFIGYYREEYNKDPVLIFYDSLADNKFIFQHINTAKNAKERYDEKYMIENFKRR